MTIITKTLDLELFCQSLEDEEFITIDTEFSRETTYYPKLCLLQIASSKRAVILDALSKSLDLSPLNKIFQNSKIVKVFHSAKQDLEILYLLNKCLPNNIFDTQIAATLCNLGESASYESLVWELLHKKIDKSYRISDWTQRPLMLKQIEYALGDVIYLRKIYLSIIAQLKETNRIAWAQEEMDRLSKETNFIIDINSAWQKIKNIDNRKINLVLKELAAWREVKAQEFNLPRNHYLKEKTLINLANSMPLTIEEIRKINNFYDIDSNTAEEIIVVIQGALTRQIEQDLYAQVNTQGYHRKNNELLSMLKLLLQLKAKEHNLPTNILATSQELKDLCSSDFDLKKIRALNGWRHQIFGAFALEIKNGNLALVMENEEMILVDSDAKKHHLLNKIIN